MIKSFSIFFTRQKILFIFLASICILQIPLIKPLLHTGFFPNHDNVQVVRVFEMYQSIQFGDFPPRWSAGLLYGHGYPVFIFYAPFAYLIGTAFVLFGFTFLTATKLTFILSFFLGGIGIYLAVRAFWGDRAGFLSSIVYSYIPYRAVDVYVRGNIAEFFAYSFFPVVLWANIKLIQSEKKIGWTLVFAVFLAILAISHNISLFIYGQFLLLFNLFWYFLLDQPKRREHIRYLLLGGLLSIGLSCFFWLPLMVETPFVQIGNFKDYPYYLYFLNWSQLWDSAWGYGGFIEENPMSLQFGKIVILLSLLAVIFNFFIKSPYRKIIYYFGFLLLFFSFMETRMSSIIWQPFAPLLSFMQFPWRYHILTTLLGAILAGGFIYLIEQKTFDTRKKVFILIVVIVLFGGLSMAENIGFFKPKEYTTDPAVSETTTWNDEYLPRWVKTKPKNYAADKVTFVNNTGTISDIDWGYLEKSFRVTTTTSSAVVQIAHIYYPGWVVRVNGEVKDISYLHDSGFMQVAVEKGESFVSFQFKRTSWRLFSELISLLSIGLVFLVGYRWLKKCTLTTVKHKKKK